ncbi:TonB-dependent receptor [Zavarzinia aquatilis]|uniref:TonB-dependent receptor n=1 Tax=Zavarzinia aquatilis TaxID=2211142 RepID=A0A317EHU2_9PROT|nr:TonB-dependent receptor plug domain-containing protein [Zavarzinia aquatilis]PWR25856.1 TonB-dependent receptor [Zavarzinia aquatilis]
MTHALSCGCAAAALLAALSPLPALAEEATALPTVTVTASPEPFATGLGAEDLADTATARPDAASLLLKLPGISLATGGAISSLPAIHGLADDRVRVTVDGMTVTSACPNHMNPPLSYIDPGRVGSIDVYAGLSPVSLGGDSIGGSIVVEPLAPRFAAEAEQVLTAARLTTAYRSNGDGLSVSGDTTVATSDFSMAYAGSWSRTLDYEGGGNNRTVYATESENYDHNLTLALRRGGDQLTLRGGLQYTPYEAFPNQRMDLTDNESQYLNGRYEGTFAWGNVDARAYWRHVEHEMDMLEDKGGAMPMNTRATDLGYNLTAEVPVGEADTLKFGTELHDLTLDDWWPPVAGSMMMGPDTYENINGGSRTRIGSFIEWNARWTSAWSSQIGLRNDIVLMDTGEVRPYAWTGMMQAADIAAAKAFNARDRSRTDVNFDLTAVASYEAGPGATYSFGYARKTRSPSLYERYSWGEGNMAAAMNNWFGDANGYIGNIDLDPEVAHTLSATGDWQGGGVWRLKVTPYVSYVEDFIDADDTGRRFGPGNQFVILKFANHDALLYGVDVSGSLALARGASFGDLDLSAAAGFVRGENRDTDDDLYRIAPLHVRLGLEHRLDDWSNGIELVASATKTDVNDVRREQETSGYALVNLKTAYQWPGVRLDAGIDNLFDQRWYDPLAGVDFATFKREGGTIGALEGEGRSFNIGLTFTY